MFIVTKDAGHEKLSVGNEEVILTGPPSRLKGHIRITNQDKEMVKVRALPIVTQEKKGVDAIYEAPLKFSTKLQPGEEKMETIYHELPLNTAPGVYLSAIMVGGEQRNLKMIVQGVINIAVYPIRFTFLDTSPGTIHVATFSVTNMGNLPFQVPVVKHLTTLDMDFLCSAASSAIREKGHLGYTETMDQLTKNIHGDLPDWVRVSIPESGSIIDPGDTMTLTLQLTLPADMNSKKDYGGNIRFWDKELTYAIKSYTSLDGDVDVTVRVKKSDSL